MYRGYFDWLGKEYKCKHDLFIEPNLIRRVDQLNRVNGRTMTQRYNSFGVGWLKCKCGCSVVFDPKEKILKQSKEQVTYKYYRCTNGKRVHIRNPVIKEDALLNQLGAAVDQISISEELAQRIADALNETQRRGKAAIKLKIENCENGIKRIDQNIALLTEKFISSSISDSAYKLTMEKY